MWPGRRESGCGRWPGRGTGCLGESGVREAHGASRIWGLRGAKPWSRSGRLQPHLWLWTESNRGQLPVVGGMVPASLPSSVHSCVRSLTWSCVAGTATSCQHALSRAMHTLWGQRQTGRAGQVVPPEPGPSRGAGPGPGWPPCRPASSHHTWLERTLPGAPRTALGGLTLASAEGGGSLCTGSLGREAPLQPGTSR